jgi:lipopolysaccharide export system ATP-binding protein
MAILDTLPLEDGEREEKCTLLLQELGIDHVRSSRAYSLSGGEKRRLAIARCLVTSPYVLLLDEPFSGVDPLAVYDIQQIIMNLKASGMGILITDHNVRETLSVVDRAYIICEGRVEREGTSDFLINDPVAREIYLGPRFSM